MLQVSFLSHCQDVTVETIEGITDHSHEEDPDFVKNPSKNFRWTIEATKVVIEGVMNHAMPTVIRRNLKICNSLNGKMPTKVQLYNKIAATKKTVFPSSAINNTHELRAKVAEYVNEPVSDIEAFVAFHEIDDKNIHSDPRFTIIMTSRKNMEKMKSDRVLQTDATYRLNWFGFPVFVVGKFDKKNMNRFSLYLMFLLLGTSTPTGRFFASCVALASHEDSPTWQSIYQHLRDKNIKPGYILGDGAKAITNAGNAVFSDIQFFRLMCWAHVHSNILPRLKTVTTHNKKLSDSILQDITSIQWSSLNEDTFRKLFDLLEDKYLGMYDVVLNGVLETFFTYMRNVWIESSEFRWYEGAHPWHISNNQGVEGKNKAIKQSYTFRRKLELGELFSVMKIMVSDWSEEDDNLLEGSRLTALHNETNSLSLRTDGYQWYETNKGSGKVLRVKNTKDNYTVSESPEFSIGEVENIWAVESSVGENSGISLKDRLKERLEHRKIPLSGTFDDYIKIRSSCWILEERDEDFFCDCPVGMKVIHDY